MSKEQQITELAEKIDRLYGIHKDITLRIEAGALAGVLDIDGPLCNAIWKAWETMLEMLDTDGWIEWHITENDGGRKKYEASLGEKPVRKITSGMDLAVMLLEGEEGA